MCRNGVPGMGIGNVGWECRISAFEGIWWWWYDPRGDMRPVGWCDRPSAKLEHGYISRYTDKTTTCKRDPQICEQPENVVLQRVSSNLKAL